MVDIVRKGEDPSVAQRDSDPFWRMRHLMPWDPFQELPRVWGEHEHRVFMPDFDVHETREAYLFRADLPGVREQDLEVNLLGNRLMITGKRLQEERREGDTWYCVERAHGAFTRTFTLPEGIDSEHIRAELKEGVLTLMVPKKAEVQPRKIAIKPGIPGGARS